jgi:spermidine synthase
LVVGSVGVGAGSMSCYARTNENWRFFEIDPLVVKLARDPKLFSYFSRCQPSAQFVMGDARLTLGHTQPGSFDYLIIDAFSSDSIPVHLLTKEAVELYLSRLSPNGLLAMHISNQHMDLHAVASTLARSIPGVHAVMVVDVPEKIALDSLISHVMFFAKSPEVLAEIKGWKGATPVAAADSSNTRTPWTRRHHAQARVLSGLMVGWCPTLRV